MIKIKSTPLVTVYITNYNYADYIEKAINSVLEQSFQDFEIIIIDDGSTDNSKEIIKKYFGYNNIKISGLESPVLVSQRNDTDVTLYIRYKISIEK